MKYIPYADKATALTRSEQMALALGAGDAPGDVTRYWYSAQDKPAGTAEDPIPADWPGDSPAAIRVTDTGRDELVLANELTAEELAWIVGEYPEWSYPETVQIGYLRRFNGGLYKCLQDHTTQVDWTPDVTGSLWTEITPPGLVGDWVQPEGGHDAYALGVLVTHGDKIWESTLPDNVWEPGSGTGWVEYTA